MMCPMRANITFGIWTCRMNVGDLKSSQHGRGFLVGDIAQWQKATRDKARKSSDRSALSSILYDIRTLKIYKLISITFKIASQRPHPSARVRA